MPAAKRTLRPTQLRLHQGKESPAQFSRAPKIIHTDPRRQEGQEGQECWTPVSTLTHGSYVTS